jgi:hypothetical protein
VKEPDGTPVSGPPQDRVLSNDEAKELGLDDAEPAPAPAVNPEALRFVAGAAALPKDAQAADIIRYSAASGLPANLVAADLENVKRRVDAAGVDWAKLAERQPKLAQYLVQNPHALPLVQKDADNLGFIEWPLAVTPSRPSWTRCTSRAPSASNSSGRRGSAAPASTSTRSSRSGSPTRRPRARPTVRTTGPTTS